jgi:hypothetical protein
MAGAEERRKRSSIGNRIEDHNPTQQEELATPHLMSAVE